MILNTHIETIDEVQKIEEVIIKDSKLTRCRNGPVEITKIVLTQSVAQALPPLCGSKTP